MKEIERFKDLVYRVFEDVVTVKVDPPGKRYGEWWINVEAGMDKIELAWREDFGFGFYEEPGYYGDRPNLIIQDPGEAFEHLCTLLSQNKETAINLRYCHKIRVLSDPDVQPPFGVPEHLWISDEEVLAHKKLLNQLYGKVGN